LGPIDVSSTLPPPAILRQSRENNCMESVGTRPLGYIDGRKIVQISGVAESEHHSLGIIALCEDGSLWERYCSFDPRAPGWGPWEQIPEEPPL
jgi:hypothetical protein